MSDYEISQNLSYADVLGNIGLISSASVPLRKSGDGFMSTPGWTVQTTIDGYLDADNLTSTAGIRDSYNRAAYGAAKGGVISLTKVMAVELATYGIMINALPPRGNRNRNGE